MLEVDERDRAVLRVRDPRVVTVRRDVDPLGAAIDRDHRFQPLDPRHA